MGDVCGMGVAVGFGVGAVGAAQPAIMNRIVVKRKRGRKCIIGRMANNTDGILNRYQIETSLAMSNPADHQTYKGFRF